MVKCICRICKREFEKWTRRLICKECMKKNKHEYALRIKQEIMKHYGGKCSCCGEDRIEFLTIDHLEGSGRKHRKNVFKSNYELLGAGLRFYLWLKRNNYPNGFQVLCYNCNCSRGFYGYCPHNKNFRKSQEIERNSNKTNLLSFLENKKDLEILVS